MRMMIAVTVAALFANTFAAPIMPLAQNQTTSGEHWQAFLDFVQQHRRVYSDEQETKARFDIFQRNLANAKKLTESHAGQATFGITRFADRTQEEMNVMRGYKAAPRPTTLRSRPATPIDFTGVPTKLDYRDRHAVTPVNDQGNCGSCYAFSAIESIESAWFLKGKGNLSALSVQQIMCCDCDVVYTDPYREKGCDGGDPSGIYTYSMRTKLEMAKDYKYAMKDPAPWDDTCKDDCSQCGAKESLEVVGPISSWANATEMDSGNETALLHALVNNGPIAICIASDTWQTYTDGILSDCGHTPDHCVQLVGYDNTDPKKPYWIVRNSWGADEWGIKGYIHLAMGKDTCAITHAATYPIV